MNNGSSILSGNPQLAAAMPERHVPTEADWSLPADPANVDHATFDSWLKLLSRTADSAAVLKKHAAHPWRGCKLASRSLSLTDDLQHHLPVLANAFETVSRTFSPIVAEQILPESPTPSTLNDTIKSIADSLNAPDIFSKLCASVEPCAISLANPYRLN